jgi:hypothetical protein
MLNKRQKLLKEKLILNENINKGGYSLRNKFQINQSLKINNHYGEATFVYIYSKFINNIILNDLTLHFYSFKKLTKIFPKFVLWLKT